MTERESDSPDYWRMDVSTTMEMASEMATLAAAMFGLRMPEEEDIALPRDALADPPRWANSDEPSFNNARARAMMDEIAFLDE